MQNLEPIKAPKWKRIELPETLLRTGANRKPNPLETVTSSSEGVKIQSYENAQSTGKILSSYRLENRAKKHLGDAFIRYTQEYGESGFFIESMGQSSITETVEIKASLSGDHVENHLVIAHEGSKIIVFMDYIEEGSACHHYGITRVIAKAGSEVTLIKSQRLGKDAVFMDQCFVSAQAGAKVSIIDVQMGSKTKGIAYEAFLDGRRADVALKSIYYGERQEGLDLSFTMRHLEKFTSSEILSKGVLDHEAKKVFRGNLIFETGSAQSVGQEREYVMLLSEKVKSDAIPALLCSEDDVIGEHAASIGQVDQMKLFYLMSRGLTESEAKKLVIKASFEEIFSLIPNDGLRELLLKALDERLDR